MRPGATRAREIRRRALRSLIIMALASSPLIWVKLRLVTGIPKMAYAIETSSPAQPAPPMSRLAELPPADHW
ncbi:MAG: hypothetical protein ACF8R7_14190 [Phycisphaerales bacterium JB039]